MLDTDIRAAESLPAELGDFCGFNALTYDHKNTIEEFIITLEKGFSDEKVLRPKEIDQLNERSYLILEDEQKQSEYYAAVQPLNLYGDDSPFHEQEWVLLGIRESKSLFAAENGFRWAVGLSMLLSLILSLIPTRVNAASSSEIKKQISALKEEKKEIDAQLKEVKSQKKENTNEIKDIVGQKDTIDREIQLLHQQIDNINQQVATYALLIGFCVMLISDILLG